MSENVGTTPGLNLSHVYVFEKCYFIYITFEIAIDLTKILRFFEKLVGD